MYTTGYVNGLGDLEANLGVVRRSIEEALRELE
jgi:hypothetical protein